jgi:pullulanase
MKKILSYIMMISFLVTMLSTTTVLVQAADEDDVKVRIHYRRFDQQYEGWNLWIWPEGGDGSAYAFDEQDDYGVVLETTIPKTGSVSKIGIIVRLNEWEAKDVEIDRFMDTSKKNSEGVLEIFLVQSEPEIFYEEAQVNLAPKFVLAELIEPNKVEIAVTSAFSLEKAKSLFKITDQKGKSITISEVTSFIKKEEVSKAIFTLEENLNIGLQYSIESNEYAKFPISLSKAFDFPEFKELFTYEGSDLGVTYSKDKTDFRVWAPTSEAVNVLIYDAGIQGTLVSTTPMKKDVNGTYIASIKGDLKDRYYTYQVVINGIKSEAVDPYATAVGVNGDRGAIIEMALTNPMNWEDYERPEFLSPTDAVIYELHIRDLSMSDSSGIQNKGKYLGLTELGTKNKEGLSTGLDHIKELGVTHVQLLPVFDYRSIDETTLEKNNFNWGYDPKNYNVPEGSYATDPYDSSLRIKEFKTMVQTLHENGLRVVMDVVLNHTGATADSHLNTLVPNYYYRFVDGKFSNGSGCGNETASERAMVRKMIVDSVVYWATEYHIDGFRFDLMGLHDIETMQAVWEALYEVDPTILIYGEGWTGGASPLSESLRLVKKNAYQVPGIGVFSDDIRDGIKGSVFEGRAAGFVNGAIGLEESIKFGVVGATQHDQIKYTNVNYSIKPWANSASQSINYAEAHDNMTLFDKLVVSNEKDSLEDRIAMNRMSASIFITAQGIPFIHAGMEFLRTKKGDENSYQSPDSINQIDWALKSEHIDVYNYYKGLIELRKAHPAFRMTDPVMINEHLVFYGMDETYGALQLPEKRMVGYIINQNANGDSAGAICVLFNANKTNQSVGLPDGEWEVLVNKEQVNLDGIEFVEGKVSMKPIETLILVSKNPVDITKVSYVEKKESEDTSSEEVGNTSADTTDVGNDTEDEVVQAETTKKQSLPYVLGGLAVVVVLGTGGYLYKKKKK